MSTKKYTYYLNFEGIAQRMMVLSKTNRYSKLAEILEISPQSITNFKKSGRFPVNLVVKFAVKNKISVDYLLNLNEEKNHPQTLKENIKILSPEVEKLEIQREIGNVIEELKKTWIPTEFPESQKDLVIWLMNSDNMIPSINKNDLLVIDTRLKAFESSGIYAFEMLNKVTVRRVQERIDGKIDILNDNPSYQSYQINPEDMVLGKEKLKILGRVVFVGKII